MVTINTNDINIDKVNASIRHYLNTYTHKRIDDLKNYKDTIPPDLDNAKHSVAKDGKLLVVDSTEFYEEISGKLLSWNTPCLITTNDTSDDAIKLQRYTYDDNLVVVNWEQPPECVTVEEYVDYLKEDLGYKHTEVIRDLEITLVSNEELFILHADKYSIKTFNVFKGATDNLLNECQLTWGQATSIRVVPKKTKLGKRFQRFSTPPQ